MTNINTFQGDVGIGTNNPGAPLEVTGPNMDGAATGTSNVISRQSAGNDGVLNTIAVCTGNGEETIGLQTQIDGREYLTDVEAGWNYGNASRYDLLLQPYKGNVGVGTSNPAVKFDVNGVARVTNNSACLQLVGTDHTFMEYYPDGISAGRKSYVGFRNADDNDFTIQNEASSGGLLFICGGADAIKVDSDQNIDITGVIRHIGDENNLFGFSGTDAFKITTAGTTRLTVNSAGTVNIGGTLTVGAFNTSQISAGTLGTARGGTGTTSVTGSGSLVKSSAPSISGNANFTGRVGIGTATPSGSCLLDIYHAFTYPGHGNQTATDVESSIRWKSNLNTYGGNPAPTYSITVQDCASIFFQPRTYQYVGSPHSGHHGCLHMSAGYSPQSFPQSESNFALSSANGLGIGTADPNSHSLDLFQRAYRARNNNAAWAFGVGGTEFYVYGGGNGVTGVYMPYNGASWVPHSSDKRTKKNFTPIENSLEKLRNIRPVLFHYLHEEDTDEKRLGFIAQDWLAQQPECVYHNESAGNLTMSLTETIPVLCAGIKELDSNQQGIQEVVNNLSDFTGQHRCLMKDISPNDYPKYEGLVVSANNNEYLNHDSITKPTINEALPIVSLTNKEKDKTCLGVISLKADPESYLPDDPTRLKINALGEGGIWTININGSLESGDYITSSNITGYGMRQDDDIIHNYTIAKITQDCDFTKKMRKIKTLVKELKDITYYKFTYKVNITKDEYDVTDESLRLAEDYEYYSRNEIYDINDTTPVGLYESVAYKRIYDSKTVSKEEYDQNQLLYDKETKYKIKDSDEIADINEEQYNLDPSKYDVEVIYSTKSKHLSKEEYDKNSSLYEVIKVKIYENKCPKDKFDAFKGDNKHEYKLIISKKYYKLDEQETTEPQPGYETEVRRELVNVLDENGQLTWTESEETETEYDLRYLTSDGNITDEANTVHIAAFVGCTYHCG